DDLDRIVAGYQESTAPLVIGHPKNHHPAYGWVQSIRRQKDRLLATISDMSTDLQQAIRDKHFKHVSIALGTKDGRLKHVGVLGAVAPAVKGLKPLTESAFSTSSDDQIYTYNESNQMDAPENTPNTSPVPTGSVPMEKYDAVMKELNETKAKLAEMMKEKESAMMSEHQANVTLAVEEAVSEGKIAPAQKAYFAEQCTDKAALEKFVAFADGSPIHAVMEPAPAAPSDKGKATLTEEEKIIALNCGLTVEEFISSKENK
nr:phage protease [Alphaproteobacteria bacterium]